MNKLEGTFGQQFNVLNEIMGQYIAAMQSIQQAFCSLVQDIRSASEDSNQSSSTMIAQLLTNVQTGRSWAWLGRFSGPSSCAGVLLRHLSKITDLMKN